MGNKKITLMVLAFLCLMTLPLFSAFSGSGAGTSDDPYAITSWEDLSDINSNTSTLSAYYELGKDLDSSTTGYDTYASSNANDGHGFAPIGYWEQDTWNEYPFNGTFDGKGNKIEDLYMESTDEQAITGNISSYTSGLFGYTENAEIKNLYVKDADVKVINSEWGAVGIVGGYLDGTSLENIRTTGNVEGGTSAAGGIVGELVEDTAESAPLIENSYSSAKVTINDDGVDIGGISGYINTGNITKTYYTGKLDYPDGTSDYGAIVGSRHSSGNVDNSFWDVNVTGLDDTNGDKGTGKTTSEMRDITTFNDTSTDGLSEAWDISTYSDYNNEIWFIADGKDYPRLDYEYDSYLSLTDNPSPKDDLLITSSKTQTFSVPVEGSDVDCNYVIGRGGTSASSQDTETGSGTFSDGKCSFTKTFSSTADNGDWDWYITASSGGETQQSSTYELSVRLSSGGGGYLSGAEGSSSGSGGENVWVWIVIGLVVVAAIVFIINKR